MSFFNALLVFVVMVSLSPTDVFGRIYEWVDENGKTHMSSQKPPKEIVDLNKYKSEIPNKDPKLPPSKYDDMTPFRIAIRIAENNNDPKLRAAGLAYVAIELSSAGRQDEALEVIAKIQNILSLKEVKNDEYAITILSNLAVSYANLSKFQKALSVVKTMGGYKDVFLSKLYICSTLSKIAQEMLDAGNDKSALEIVNRIECNYPKAQYKVKFAESLAIEGKNAEAIQFLRQAQSLDTDMNSIQRTVILSWISEVYARIGKKVKSLAVLMDATHKYSEIKNISDKSMAISRLSSAYFKAGQETGAITLLSQLLTSANSVEESSKKAACLVYISDGFRVIGKQHQARTILEAALKTVQKAGNKDEYAGISKGFAQLGRFEKALNVADKIWPDSIKAAAFAEIGRYMDKSSLVSPNLTKKANVLYKRYDKSTYTLELLFWTWLHIADNKYIEVRGEIKNISPRALKDVEVVVTFYDNNSRYVTHASALIEYNPIPPGQKSPFRVLKTNNPMISKAGIKFKTLFGGRIRIYE